MTGNFGTDGGGPTPGIERFVCNYSDHRTFQVRQADANRLGVGLLCTEFGAVGSTVDGLRELDVVTGDADANSPPVSWLYWDDSIFFNPLKLKHLGRPYAQTVAGTITAMHFEAGDRSAPSSFTLRYTTSATARGTADTARTTEIFLNTVDHFPGGKYTVAIAPPNVLAFYRGDKI